MAVSTAIMFDYKVLFARHSDYKSDEYKAQRSDVHAKAASRLLALCKTQGAVYVKVGQHVASMTHGVPREFTSTLIQLEDRAASRPYAQVERVLKKELGGEVHDHFSSFEEQPVAAASLAQVHRATLSATGETVACKVQYPGLATLVAGDLASIRFLSYLLTKAFPWMSLDWMVDQFRENLAVEIDFEKEAEASERTRLFFEGMDDCVAVPKIFERLSGRKVLTMEYIDGFRVDDVERIAGAGLDKNEVARAVVEGFAKMTFLSGHVHCDGVC